MALKYKYATKQEIPAEHQSLYVERDGAWLLDADGVVSQSKLDEFRQNNIALTNQLKRFEGIDPDAVRQLADDKRKLEEASSSRPVKWKEALIEAVDLLKKARVEAAQHKPGSGKVAAAARRLDKSMVSWLNVTRCMAA